jgi:fucose permease
VFWIAVTIGRLFWLPFAKRVRPELALTGSVVGCLGTLAALLWHGSSSAFVTGGTFVFGLAMSSIFPSAFTLLAQRVGMTGKVSGACLCSASVGAMFFPWWVGQFLQLH